MKCENCCYFWYDEDSFGIAREFCHWESRCPDDIPPCEENEPPYGCYDDEDEYYPYNADIYALSP